MVTERHGACSFWREGGRGECGRISRACAAACRPGPGGPRRAPRSGRVRVDELGDLAGHGLPVVDQLGLGDQLADAAADHVDADDRAVLDAGRA